MPNATEESAAPPAQAPDEQPPTIAGVPVRDAPPRKGRPKGKAAKPASPPNPNGKTTEQVPVKERPAPKAAAPKALKTEGFTPEATGRRLRYPACAPNGGLTAACRHPVDWLRHLADPTRAATVLLIHTNGEMAVNEICDGLDGISQPALSHHLALLRHSRIIEPRRQGKNNFYGLTVTGSMLAQMLVELF
jgi:DNA-binding HxlR family transcriptional regulator